MKIVKWGVISILVLIVVLLIGGYSYLRSTLPDYTGDIAVKGIIDNVEIIRDSYGMAHIYAKSDNDAFFALGYCAAQDRLFHMDLVRRAARGRLAEIMGPPLVKVDKLFRTITAGKRVEEMIREYPPDIMEAGNAYAAGVNFYLKNREGPLPIEFTILGYAPEPWQFSDSVAVIYYMAWDLNAAFSNEMLYASVIKKLGEKLAKDLFPAYPEGYPTIIPEGSAALDFLKTNYLAREILGVEGGGASNNWVISGKKSVTGKPILANDPHLGHGAPGIWYEAHLVTPTMNVSGAFLPGSPYVVIGANNHVAWGFTNVMADDTDFYIEKINPADPNQYEYKGKWEQMEIREETIKVKGSDDVTFKIRLTQHGPVIDHVNDYREPEGTAMTMHWAAYENFQILRALKILNTARSIDDVERAADYFKCPGQNWVYADDQGNIGFWAAVGIPRREGFTGALPLEGWSGKYEWNGYVPTKEQPHLRNPERGWIATANNRHVGEDYPYPISHYYAMPDRFVRIKEMLLEKEKLSVEDFQRMHNDFYMVMAAEWVPVMLETLSNAELSQKEKEALAALKAWDHVAGVDEVAPTIFHTIINAMVKNTYEKRMGEDLYKLYIKNNYVVFNSLRNLVAQRDSAWFDDPDTSEKETLDHLITASYKEAVASLEKQLGPDIDTWIWGELHTLTIQHPFGRASALMGFFFNIGPFPMGGSVATVNPQPYKLSDPWDGYHGASLRYIIDFSNRENSRRVIPAGISGNFMSPHYKDQVDLWRTCEYRPFVLDRESIDKDKTYVLNMRPE